MLISQPAPSGDLEANERFLVERAATAPFLAGLSATRLRSDGAPQMEVVTDEERHEQQLGEYEAQQMSIRGAIIAETLERSLDRFDPDEDQLRAVLSPSPGDPNVGAVARALVHYHQGDFEAASLDAESVQRMTSSPTSVPR